MCSSTQSRCSYVLKVDVLRQKSSHISFWIPSALILGHLFYFMLFHFISLEAPKSACPSSSPCRSASSRLRAPKPPFKKHIRY